jgi:hypothetical protein
MLKKSSSAVRASDRGCVGEEKGDIRTAVKREAAFIVESIVTRCDSAAASWTLGLRIMKTSAIEEAHFEQLDAKTMWS